MYTRLSAACNGSFGRQGISIQSIEAYLRLDSDPLILLDPPEIIELISEMDEVHLSHLSKEQSSENG